MIVRHGFHSVNIDLLNTGSFGNKSTIIGCMIEEGGCDVVLLTKNWHTTSDDISLRRCVPPEYVCLDVP